MARRSTFEARLKLRLNPMFGSSVREGAKAGLALGLQKITQSAMRRSPYDTGHNARGISWAVKGGPAGGGKPEAGRTETEAGTKPDGITGAVFTTSGYGGLLETGTVRMSARPYIRPSVEEHHKYTLRAMFAEIQRRMK